MDESKRGPAKSISRSRATEAIAPEWLSYAAVVRLGISTDTGDADGTPVGSAFAGPFPSRDAIDGALDAFRGTFLQQPPVFSAKKIGGRRSHRLARRRSLDRLESDSSPTSLPAPVTVTVHRLEIVDELPMTSMLKVDKRVLAARIASDQAG